LYEFVTKGFFTPLVASILINKGLTDIKKAYAYLYPSIQDFSNPLDLPGALPASKRIYEALTKGETIGIYGDSDADGILGTFVLTHFLKELGAKVVTLIPSKESQGYGFHSQFLPFFKERGVSLLLTVDVGISNANTVEQAKTLGMDVIVTDHHEIQSLPDCLVVSGKLCPISSPFYYLCGAGVVFTLIRCLRVYLKEQGFFKNRIPKLKKYLEPVSIATLADMVPLVGENRVITYFGLKELAEPKFFPVRFLTEKLGIRYRITEDDIYFKIVPKINAPGRLGYPELVLELFLAEDYEKAEKMWSKIQALNDKRQAIETELIEKLSAEAERQAKASNLILLVEEGIPKGILGLIANRFKGIYDLPTIVLTTVDGIAFGSGRAPEGLNFLDIVKSCKDLLVQVGGHPNAFGLQVKVENIEKLKERLSASLKHLEPQKYEKIYIDAEVSLAELLLEENLIALSHLHPYGEGNEPPNLLLKNFEVKELTILKEKHSKLRLAWGTSSLKAICFNKILGKEIRFIVGTPFVNPYDENLEIYIRDVK